MTSSPDTGAGTPLTAEEERRAIAADRTWASGYAAGRAAARSRPATDPAGLDVNALAEALDACLPDDINAGQPGNRVRAKAIAREYRARLSVADGPGPE